MFVIVLGIFSLTTYESNGHYKCRHQRLRTNLVDTFIVGAQLEKINCSKEGTFQYNMLPYPVYKYRTRLRTKEPFIDAFSIENIQRPACLFEFYRNTGGASTASNRVQDYLPVRFCLFDYPSCDRSLWNSSTDTTERAYATAASAEEADVGFMLYHDEQLSTFCVLEQQANGVLSGNNIEDDDDDHVSSSDDEEEGRPNNNP